MTGPAVDAARWSAAVARESVDRATRLVAGQLADRATRDGRVRVSPGQIASCACLPITAVADAPAHLVSLELVARDDRHLVLVVPGRTPEGR